MKTRMAKDVVKFFILTLGALACAGELRAVEDAAEPSELSDLRRRYEERQRAAVRPVLLEYKAELVRLQNALYTRKASPAALEAVGREMEKIATELDASNPRGRVLADDTPGSAGIDNANNIYKFNVTTTNKRVVLRYWAVGNPDRNTFGRVIVTGPDSRSRAVDDWTPERINKTAAEARSFKSFDPRELAVTQVFAQPGEYRIEFKYDKGPSGLKILRVEIEFR